MSDTPEKAISEFLEYEGQVTDRTIFECPQCQCQITTEQDEEEVGIVICCKCDEEMVATSQRCTITYSLEGVVQLDQSYGVLFGFGELVYEPSNSSNSEADFI